MNVQDILVFNARILFILLSFVAIVDYARHRSSQRRDFALMASALGLPFGITFLRSIYPIQSAVLDLAGAFALFSQPYFLFRLLQYFHPSRRGIGAAVLIGLLFSYVLLLNQMAANPALTITIIFSYCAIVEAICTWGFYQGMLNTVGTLRRRLSIITISSTVFTLAFIINVIKAQLPTLSPSITPIAQAAAAVSAILFYVAFIPPRWLRRAWQMEDLYTYLSHFRIAPANETYLMDNFQKLSRGAIQATNGMASGILKLNEAATKWDILTASDQTLFTELLKNAQPLLNRVWQQRQAICTVVPDSVDAEDRHLLQTLGTQTWLFVPIQNQERLWGLLIVALQDRSLFVEEDLSLLELLTHECALVLDNHRLIEQLQSYSGQLERKVEERTAALQRSNEELRRYAHIASHDLQEPLRTITSYLQLLELRFPDKVDDESHEFITFAVNGAIRMKHMINDLLMYSRFDNRTRTFTLLDMQQVLDKTRNILEKTIAETDALITHESLPQIIANEELILHLFQNLIDNALKYRSERRPEIHISAICKDQEWTFSIRDNGIGIEKQFLERIFIIFQRLHTQDRYPGTGVGLAICKKAVELHDGHIWAESEEGQGTTFHFTIPVRDGALPLANAS